MKEIQELIAISQKYGKDSRYVIAGGGNTSYKNNEKLWVKASGFSLATIGEEGFAVMNRERLNLMADKIYSTDAADREEEVKNDLAFACITKERRPSVETSLHNALSAAFVIHLHPTLVNSLMCAQNAEKLSKEFFGDRALYIPYTDPGYTLYKKVHDGIVDYKAKQGKEPEIILLQNHGIFVGADTTEEVEKIYDEVLTKIEQHISCPVPQEELPVCSCASEIIPAIRMMVSRQGRGLKTLNVTNNALIHYFCQNEENFAKVCTPFTPDEIVYCKSAYLYIAAESQEALLSQAEEKIENYIKNYGFTPKVILIKGIGLVAVGDHAKNSEIIRDVFMDALQIAWQAQAFGGEHPMTAKQTAFIDAWEVENYRRKISAGNSTGRAENKTFIITGAAQGFGEGIARCLIAEGANIVVADLNAEVGEKTVESLNTIAKNNRAAFVKVNVTDMESLYALVTETACRFGGIDVFISNAGVLRAGGLEAMTPETFEFVTKINYSAFFYCSKVVSKIMKIQNQYDKENFCDIIQINSKSGLRGSKANFAYAGGKFGGIGLAQSFALELAPFRVKVNCICPGNFYDGPLWSNPENGLFLQYLQAGKVPGAKNIQDVKDYYLAQAPMHKGCSPSDVTKAVLYAIEQTCETGQAIPITGGQVMLS